MQNFSWIYKSLDAALTAHLHPGQDPKGLFHSVIRQSSNYNRVSALTNLLDRMAPGLAERLSSALLRTKHFPLADYRINLLAYGSGATVFLLENGAERKVLKVYRRSLGQPIQRVWAVAREFQEKHQTLASWFNHSDEIVIPSQFLVLHGPLLGVSSAAVLQPFLLGRKYDPFLDFSVEEIVQLAQKQPHLRQQFIDFSRHLFQAVEETGLCFDLVGRENLLLVEIGGEKRLRIADNGMFDVASIRQHSPALFARLQSHLQQLRSIQRGLERR